MTKLVDYLEPAAAASSIAGDERIGYDELRLLSEYSAAVSLRRMADAFSAIAAEIQKRSKS